MRASTVERVALMTESIPGIILAGGQATRMGGGDKALMRVSGTRLIDHVISRLKPQCGPLALNANGDPGRFNDLKLPVLQDSITGFPGPLAGVLAGLDWAAEFGATHIVSVAADTPFFPDDLVARLILEQSSNGLCLAASQVKGGHVFRQPTFGFWPVALREDLRAALRDGVRKVGLWADKNGAGQAIFQSDDFDPFFNINTPEDIAEAQRLISGAAQ